ALHDALPIWRPGWEPGSMRCRASPMPRRGRSRPRWVRWRSVASDRSQTSLRRSRAKRISRRWAAGPGRRVGSCRPALTVSLPDRRQMRPCSPYNGPSPTDGGPAVPQQAAPCNLRKLVVPALLLLLIAVAPVDAAMHTSAAGAWRLHHVLASVAGLLALLGAGVLLGFPARVLLVALVPLAVSVRALYAGLLHFSG